ncbi:nucleotidyl transferase AbiEii/AbiGii toxin family protein [Candidatus Thiothrix sp. Deng01]|uniref:Nucleotidyl transferase AbiEii/AbiGii toxin family protein n=1 Tax=Candidatus Thiothrix phosphatis TaxID=3112415 RepID=A0ABU6D3A0_9GAMM|nr:nucleotidyl transferase AbiEii/AbiGii toxin family protein [Candidatus Thiothrix sp. Deng01]MEB4593561.1 nucleotidyl transferase AbiEii/AbiGii toxin family protein [Candidatus Thiothrix sp. Deng01]
MAMTVLEQMLGRHPSSPVGQQEQTLREVMQEITLAGLNRAWFFEQAAFYGGTCLRIFHGLPRFSEDLDFSLLQPNADFSLQPYFKAVLEEFHALLFRQWKNRVKGRDWFDFEWYVRHGVTPNLEHFARRAYESGAIRQDAVSKAELHTLLQQRIQSVDFNDAKQDVVKFIPDAKVLNIWSTDYFLQLTQQLIESC